MIIGLDHIVLLTHNISAATASYETLLAQRPAWRTIADGVETAIFTLANMSLELMAPSGDGEMARRVRARLDERGEDLASLCFRVEDIDRFQRRLKRLGLLPEDVTQSRSTNAADGAALSWKRTRTAVETTHGVRLFFLEPSGERPVSKATAGAPITGLDHVVIATDQPERAAALYGARLRLDMTLDLSRPDWGARLMFFRCGDLVVEIVHRLNDPSGGNPDRLWGLSWRVTDIEAAQTRLISSGLDASEIRTGRRPGTRVFTVRTGTLGVPTLVIQPV
ncbi:VOC family protein [Bradyrhizobium sp. LHD-71]|uniref:VOC family protein n=1 Tax=Bradyrhizobium sp. LHD-71 TaxID=3072141 RepID=UPI00280D1B21|nr:VOC family protein [Bradyrhizobium sp. LHD-71]MDQ8730842.1 VOC family protein [Bradyrhizobium sp. LHD-71]